MSSRHLAPALIAALAVVTPPARLVAQDPKPVAVRKPVEREDQLPAHSYKMSVKPSQLLADSAGFARFTDALRKDLEADLREFDIRDKSTLRNYHATLANIALFQRRYGDVAPHLDTVQSLEEKPALRLLSGLASRAILAAKRKDGTTDLAVFRKAFHDRLAALPYDSVQAELKSMKGMYEVQSSGVLLGIVEETVDPSAKGGTISKEGAFQLFFTKYAIVERIPLAATALAELGPLIAAHHVEKKDIWAARDVALADPKSLTPAVAAIWDVGTDVTLFPGRLWTNTREVPGNGKDDDGNGYVDDVNGIGWSWMGEKGVGPLRAVPFSKADVDGAKQNVKGFGDLQANIESSEADAVKKKMSTLPKDSVKAFIERVSFYGNYAHGTHVAGIVARGNPVVRLLVVRMDFPYTLVEPLPTQQWADAQARVMRESIAYMKAAGVRVVNMSWTYDPKEIEHALEVNNAGGNPDQRKALAGKYFDVIAKAFKDAIVKAPEILFVSAAGNEDNDPRFVQSIPAAFTLANTLSVGAVDKAGDEAAFTSFGKVEVYANGYEVESVLPGGDRQNWSGTSMATPQVVNLAAKLLATSPSLTTAQLRELIVNGAERKAIGKRTIRLLNAKRSFELLKGTKRSSA